MTRGNVNLQYSKSRQATGHVWNALVEPVAVIYDSLTDAALASVVAVVHSPEGDGAAYEIYGDRPVRARS
jgi:hypothetical protein